MHSVNSQRVLALLTLFALLAGCRLTQQDAVQSTAAPRATITRALVASTASPSQTTPAEPKETATSEPTPLPTTTPVPPLIAIPAAWETAVGDELPPSAARFKVSEQPAELLAAGEAQLAIAPTAGGQPLGRQPLAITVPFATDWQQVTLAQAREIITTGHSLATVTPWSEIGPRERALYVEGRHVTDPAYPLQQEWSLLAAPGYDQTAAELADRLRLQNPFGKGDVQLAAVGDVMLDRALGVAISSGDLAFPFAHVKTTLQAADLALANLECALGNVGQPAEKSYTFRAPPDAARSLAQAGVDIVSLANNHALDFGPSALLQGIDLLHGAGVAAIGAGPDARSAHAPAVVTVNDLTITFLAYVDVPVEGQPPYFDTQTWTATTQTPGLAWAIPEVIQKDVAAARETAEQVVVLLHSGYEYVPGPSPEQRAAAYAAIDAGASMVIGHHAHILQGVEFYGEGVIVYGLGNFAFTITGPPETAILRAWLDEGGVRQLDFVPAIVQDSGQPRLATEQEAATIRQRIYALSAGLR